MKDAVEYHKVHQIYIGNIGGVAENEKVAGLDECLLYGTHPETPNQTGYGMLHLHSRQRQFV